MHFATVEGIDHRLRFGDPFLRGLRPAVKAGELLHGIALLHPAGDLALGIDLCLAQCERCGAGVGAVKQVQPGIAAQLDGGVGGDGAIEYQAWLQGQQGQAVFLGCEFRVFGQFESLSVGKFATMLLICQFVEHPSNVCFCGF